MIATTTLSTRRIGALMVIERQIGLRNYIESGIPLDATIMYDLLASIFHPGTPLHDGAIIVQADRVAAAACFLPLSVNPRVSRELGTRHRAALGVTEESDAIAIVVSEETGGSRWRSARGSSGDCRPTCCASPAIAPRWPTAAGYATR